MPQEPDPDLDKAFDDPDRPTEPEPAPMSRDEYREGRRQQRQDYREGRKRDRADYYAERYGDDHAQAEGRTVQQATAEEANAAIGVGGDQELVAAIRELIVAVRGIQGS